MQNLIIGDIVELKSGGPKMTVSNTQEDNITCIWFNNGIKSFDTFNAAALEKVSKFIPHVRKLDQE